MRSRTLRTMTVPGPVRVQRRITGIERGAAAVLGPRHDRLARVRGARRPHDGRRHHTRREHGHRLRAAARAPTTASARSSSRPQVTGGDFVAGAYVRRRGRARRSTSTRHLRAAEAVVARAARPVIFPSHGLNGLDDDGMGRAHVRASAPRSTASSGSSSARCSCPTAGSCRPRRVPRADGDRAVHRRQALVAEPAARSGTDSRCAMRSGRTSTCSPATTSRSTW